MQKINNDIEKIYDEELKKAIINGDGSEENPYEVDYSLAPEFEGFVITSYNNAKTETSEDGSFTQHVLTKHLGKYSNGGLWTYKSGGLKVSSDGNLRIVKAIYLSEQQANELYVAKKEKTAWDVISTAISDISLFGSAAIIGAVVSALKKAGITKVGSYATDVIGNVISRAVGAIGTYVGFAAMIKRLLDSNEESLLSTAVSEKKNFIHIYYMTAYHGEWYAHTTSEVGWKNNDVYIPSSTYGEGAFVTK